MKYKKDKYSLLAFVLGVLIAYLIEKYWEYIKNLLLK
jgi:hypothetical protein